MYHYHTTLRYVMREENPMAYGRLLWGEYYYYHLIDVCFFQVGVLVLLLLPNAGSVYVKGGPFFLLLRHAMQIGVLLQRLHR
jgi:hypothetical protein